MGPLGYTPEDRQKIKEKVFSVLGWGKVSKMSASTFKTRFSLVPEHSQKAVRSLGDRLGYTTFNSFITFGICGEGKRNYACAQKLPSDLFPFIESKLNTVEYPGSFARSSKKTRVGYSTEETRTWRLAVEKLLGITKNGEAWSMDEVREHIISKGKSWDVMRLLNKMSYPSPDINVAKNSVLGVPYDKTVHATYQDRLFDKPAMAAAMVAAFVQELEAMATEMKTCETWRKLGQYRPRLYEMVLGLPESE